MQYVWFAVSCADRCVCVCEMFSIMLSFCFSFQPVFQYLDTVCTEINSVPVVFLLGLLEASALGKVKEGKFISCSRN